MEFPFSLDPLVQCGGPASELDERVGEQHVLQCWSWSRVESLRSRPLLDGVWAPVIEGMGRASAAAQGLKAVITTPAKFAHSADRIYLHLTPSLRRVNGLLRTGRKRLFIRDEVANIAEIEPPCVLDFFVHESLQRQGVGREMFEFMLRAESAGAAGGNPARYGYDRPSPKLLAFLSKHYALSSFVPQNNNFVVFRKYFTNNNNNNAKTTGGHGRHASQQQQQQQPHHTRAPPAGTRSKPHPSSSTLMPSLAGEAAGDPAGLSPRGGGGPHHERTRSGHTPRDQINQQGGPTSGNYHGSRTRGGAGGAGAPLSLLQASPPPGQAAFAFDEGSIEDGVRTQLRFGSEQQLAQQDRAYARQQQQQQYSPRGSPTAAARHHGGGGFSSHSRDGSGSGGYGSSSASQLDASSYSLSGSSGGIGGQYRRTPPGTSGGDGGGGSRLARAGTNVLSTGNLQHNNAASASAARSSSPAASRHQQHQQSGQHRELPTIQYHQHNIITGYVAGSTDPTAGGYDSNFSSRPNDHRRPRPSAAPGAFLPDGHPPPQQLASTLPSELPVERRIQRGGVAPRPLADPGTMNLPAQDAAIREREAELARKEAMLQAGATRYAIPYRQPNHDSANWSKAASYQRVTYGFDEGQGGAAAAASSSSAAASRHHLQTEKAAQFSNPQHSPLVGGGQASYPHGAPQHVYANGIPQRSNFAYGSRR